MTNKYANYYDYDYHYHYYCYKHVPKLVSPLKHLCQFVCDSNAMYYAGRGLPARITTHWIGLDLLLKQ